jgi:hypothetical protein
MAARNPNPALITDAIWSVWTGFDAHEPTALLGGIYALKRGYHSTRRDNQTRWPGDYSIRLAADLRGPNDKGAALDLTMSTAAMIRTTKRLDAAARAKDPRLYRNGQPVLREFIGTLDGETVYCYDLVERRVYLNRDKSHLWHLHGSWLRQFVADMLAAAGILSVLVGESLAAWTARTNPSKEDPMALSADTQTADTYRLRALLTGEPAARYTVKGQNRSEPNAVKVALDTLTALVQSIAARVDVDQAEVDRIVAAMPRPASPEDIAAAVVAELGAQGPDEAAQALVSVLGLDRAAQLAQALAELVSAAAEPQQQG